MLVRTSDNSAGLILVSIITALTVLLTGCTTGPGNLIVKPVKLDAEIDNHTRKLIERELGVVNDPLMVSYLNSVAGNLIGSGQYSEENNRIVIYDRYTPNIFAIPGLTIFISRGMLALLQSEDELAHLVAHEIAHANLKHSNRQMATFPRVSFLKINGVLVDHLVRRDIEPLLYIPLKVLIRGYMASHSPRDEYAADTYGQLLAADAGYDPAAMSAILNRLKNADIRVPGELHVPAFMDTHVSEFYRIERLRDEADSIEWKPKQEQGMDSTGFMKKLDGLMVGVNPERGLMKGQQFLHPSLDMVIKFPFDWTTAITDRAAVGVAPRQNAVMVLYFEGENAVPETVATRYLQTLEQEIGVKPIEQNTFNIGGRLAYLAIFQDTTGDKTTCVVLAWIAHHGKTYRLIGIGPERRKPLLKQTVFSFRPLTSTERNAITKLRLKVVRARSDENIAQMSRRTNNSWDIGTTIKMNGLEYERPPREGQLLKIAVSEPLR